MGLAFASSILLIRAAAGRLCRASIAARAATLIGISVSVSAISACSPVPPPAAPPPPLTAFLAATDAQCSVSTDPPFVRNLRMLSGYNPDPSQAGGKSAPVGTTGVPASICTTLRAAYNAADQSLKDDLDHLTNTFILNGCSDSTCSWGYVDKISGNGTHRYIGLSSALWAADGTPITYSQLYTQIAGALIPGADGRPVSMQAAPDGPSLPSLGLIAALSHEMGHIEWWDKGIQNLNTCSDPLTHANTNFSSIAWSNAPNTPSWRGFGAGDVQSSNLDGLSINGLREEAGEEDEDGYDLNDDLIKLYQGRWPSVFAIVSPDEDYVETYTLMQVVLAMRKQSASVSLRVTILPDFAPNVADLISYHDNSTDHSAHQSDLHHKVRWIKKCAM